MITYIDTRYGIVLFRGYNMLEKHEILAVFIGIFFLIAVLTVEHWSLFIRRLMFKTLSVKRVYGKIQDFNRHKTDLNP